MNKTKSRFTSMHIADSKPESSMSWPPNKPERSFLEWLRKIGIKW